MATGEHCESSPIIACSIYTAKSVSYQYQYNLDINAGV